MIAQTIQQLSCLDEMMEGRDERSDTVVSSDCGHLWNRCFKETRRATSSSNADQWGRYRRARARVRCRIDFVKVPARTEIQDVWSGRITARSWGGNLFADSSRESCKLRRQEECQTIRLEFTSFPATMQRAF